MARPLHLAKGDFVTIHAPVSARISDVTPEGIVELEDLRPCASYYTMAELRRHPSGALVFRGTIATVEGLPPRRRPATKPKNGRN